MPVGRAVSLGGSSLDEGQTAIANSRASAKNAGGEISSGPAREPQGSFADKLATARANIVAAASTPQRMYIQSVDRPTERVDAQFNPEKLKETIGVDWQKFRIPGLSHQRLQYGSTNNVQYRFELVFNAAAGTALHDILHDGSGTPGISPESLMTRILSARDTLQAWALLRRQEDLGAVGDTQRLLFVWPNFISLTCVLVAADFEYEAFNLNGPPTYFKVDVLLEEIRDVRLYAEDVLAMGTQRSGQAPEAG